MAHFKPCLGKTACIDGDGHCRTCGRTFEEIGRTREAIDGLTRLVLQLDYDNPQEFADYVARRLIKKVAHTRETEDAL